MVFVLYEVCYDANLLLNQGNAMKKIIVVLMMLGAMQLAFAARALPINMDIAVLKAYQGRQVELSPDGFTWLKFFTLGWLDKSKVFNMSVAVTVKDESNRFITYGRLTKHLGKVVAVKRDPYNNINEIWVLTDREREQFRQIAKQREANQQ